eukprot:1547957-Amphidinium_carterae.1
MMTDTQSSCVLTHLCKTEAKRHCTGPVNTITAPQWNTNKKRPLLEHQTHKRHKQSVLSTSDTLKYRYHTVEPQMGTVLARIQPISRNMHHTVCVWTWKTSTPLKRIKITIFRIRDLTFVQVETDFLLSSIPSFKRHLTTQTSISNYVLEKQFLNQMQVGQTHDKTKQLFSKDNHRKQTHTCGRYGLGYLCNSW